MASVKDLLTRACALEEQLRTHDFIAPDTHESLAKDGPCSGQTKSALDGDASHSTVLKRIRADLPYGTLLSAMLLSAANEIDAAVQDLDRWVRQNSPRSGAESAADARWIFVYRARAQAALLLWNQMPDGPKGYLVAEYYSELLKIGEHFLNATTRVRRKSWRMQRERFDAKGSGESRWQTALCANDVTPAFKRFMLAHLSAMNNRTYFLSKHLDFSHGQARLDELRDNGHYLARADVACLQPPLPDGELLKQVASTQSSFLDTAALAELALAKSKDREATKREHLCRARERIDSL